MKVLTYFERHVMDAHVAIETKHDFSITYSQNNSSYLFEF